MIHRPIPIKKLTISFPGKGCFADFSCQVHPGSRIAIIGNSGTGKSTLLKAILGEKHIVKTGSSYLPKPEGIGYLDQHYANLDPENSVIDHLIRMRVD